MGLAIGRSSHDRSATFEAVAASIGVVGFDTVGRKRSSRYVRRPMASFVGTSRDRVTNPPLPVVNSTETSRERADRPGGPSTCDTNSHNCFRYVLYLNPIDSGLRARSIVPDITRRGEFGRQSIAVTSAEAALHPAYRRYRSCDAVDGGVSTVHARNSTGDASMTRYAERRRFRRALELDTNARGETASK